MLSSVLDFLVKRRILADDNQRIVREVRGRIGGVNKVNSRCEIFITAKEKNE
jgi:hypothetical protein